jgi:hypothetical protein
LARAKAVQAPIRKRKISGQVGPPLTFCSAANEPAVASEKP